MGSYGCPVCAEVVSPLGWIEPGKATNGHTDNPDPEDLPVESRTCPACRTHLERKPPGSWQLAPIRERAKKGWRRRFRRDS